MSSKTEKQIKIILVFMAFLVLLSSCNDKKQKKENEWAKNTEKLQELNDTINNAIEQRNVSAFVDLYKSGIYSYEGQPLLTMATRKGWDEGVIELIKNGANIYGRSTLSLSRDGYAFIDLAIIYLKEETVLKIIDDGFDFNQLGNDDIREIFITAVKSKKVKLKKRLFTTDAFVKKIQFNDELCAFLMRHWTDDYTPEIPEILEELIKKGVVLPNDGSLYVYSIMYDPIENYNAVKWLIANGFSTSMSYEVSLVSSIESYWWWLPEGQISLTDLIDFLIQRGIKSIDDTDYSQNENRMRENLRKVKELIEANNAKEDGMQKN